MGLYTLSCCDACLRVYHIHPCPRSARGKVRRGAGDGNGRGQGHAAPPLHERGTRGPQGVPPPEGGRSAQVLHRPGMQHAASHGYPQLSYALTLLRRHATCCCTPAHQSRGDSSARSRTSDCRSRWLLMRRTLAKPLREPPATWCVVGGGAVEEEGQQAL